jgi:peptide/nickel transport system substrate-binding protein
MLSHARHRELAAFSLAVSLAVLPAAGCARRAAAPIRPLRVALYDDPLTLDPHLRNELLTFSVLKNLYEALTAFDAGTKIGPALAESWENPNELTWVFHLRSAVHFHDGREFTARDVVWSFDRARNLPRSNVSNYLVAIDKVTALDPHTVQITTLRPYPILLNKLAFVLIVPAGSPSEIHQPVGTGPYRLSAYEPGKRIELAAFERYWGGVPPERRVELLPITSSRERVQRLLAGELDVVQEPQLADLTHIAASPGCRVIEQDSLGVVYLSLRRDRRPFDDLRVRRAIDLALDRGSLVREGLNGEGVPVGQMVGRNVFGYAADLRPPVRDLPQARRLLAEAGFPGGIDLDLHTRSGRHAEAEALRRQLLAAGIRLRLIERPWAEIFQHILAGDVDFYLGGWFCLSGDASDLFDSLVHSREGTPGYGASNFNHYVNPALDTVVEQSASTLDLLTRRAQLQRCMRLLMDDLAFIPLYSPFVVFGARDDIEWQLRRDGLILANTIRRRPAGE